MRLSLKLAACTILLCAGTVQAAQTAQQKCDQARVKAWRMYVSCVEEQVAKDAGGYVRNPAALTKCRHRYFAKWNVLQGATYAGTSCDETMPSVGGRFTDHGDGTVTDNLSGLTWEKKTDDGTIHHWGNGYQWSTVSYKGDGTAYAYFLLNLNENSFGGTNDWRLPTLAELQTIVLDFPCTTTSCSCPSNPCIVPDLGYSSSSSYWSATSSPDQPTAAWVVFFNGCPTGCPSVFEVGKNQLSAARAVRGGW